MFSFESQRHGRRKHFFKGGALGDFSKIFQEGAKSGKICFFPLEINKTTFSAKIVKMQGVQGFPCPPSNAHGQRVNEWNKRASDVEFLCRVRWAGVKDSNLMCSSFYCGI